VGGVAGHMNHLYDNPKLTFGKIKDIFNKASEGKLIGTEKTDGVNLFVSYSVREKRAKAARNKSNLKDGGLTPKELEQKFSGRGELMKAFTDGFTAFESSVRAMPVELQIDLFGPDANIFYNAEIMDPRSPNVINYDTQNMVIHRVGHLLLDKETGEAKPYGNDEMVSVLEDALSSIQSAKTKEDYGVQVNAVRKLEKFANNHAAADAVKRLDDIMSAAGMSDSNNIGDYIVKKTGEKIEKTLPNLDPEIKMMIQKRMLGQKGDNITAILKTISDQPENIRNMVTTMVQGSKPHLGVTIYPIEDIVHDFSVEALKGLESAFLLDNKREVGRLRKEVEQALEAVEQADDEEVMRVLGKQLKKLKSAENVTTAAEGFVFDYDGETYKFTGNFAPVNQLLGVFKYGRGKIPPLKIDKSETIDEHETESEKTQIYVYPGRFQPMGPHHAETYKKIAEEYGADNVYVATSDKVEFPKSPFNFKEKREIMVRHGIPEDKIIKVKNPYHAIELLQKYEPEDTEVTYFVGEKDMTEDPRFGPDNREGTSREGYEWNIARAPHVSIDIEGIGEMSGTSLRNALRDADENRFKEIMGWFDPGVHNMIVSALNSLEEISAMGGGAVAGYSGNKRKRTLIRQEETIMREEIVMEMKLREIIRKRIGGKKNILRESIENKDPGIIYVNQRQKDEIDKYQMEHYLRKCIRKLILLEKEELPPHRSTGINVLQDLLMKIIPSLKTGYKSLTTDIEQRSSFRSHIINAVVNSLAPIELDDEASEELKEIELDVKDDADADKFIDIGDSDFVSDDEEEEKFQTLPGKDLTGRNVAMQAYERVEKQTVDAYADLDNEQDQKMFYDYLIANLKLYFDKFEDQLKDELPEPTSATYEREKEKADASLPESPPIEEVPAGAEEEPLGERLMKKRGIGKQINESSITPALSYQLGYNQYYRNNADGDDKSAVRAGMVKALEDADAGPAEALEVLDKVPSPSTASGGSKDLYMRFQAAKKEAVKQYFDANRSLSPMGEVYSKKQRDMACARKEKEPEFAEMCTGPMKKKKKKKKSS